MENLRSGQEAQKLRAAKAPREVKVQPAFG